jgi:hypothetical protein
VTRLGEFSTMGRLFTFRQFFQNQPNFGCTFSRKKLRINFDNKWVEHILGQFFHILIWSLWLTCTLVKWKLKDNNGTNGRTQMATDRKMTKGIKMFDTKISTYIPMYFSDFKVWNIGTMWDHTI